MKLFAYFKKLWSRFVSSLLTLLAEIDQMFNYFEYKFWVDTSAYVAHAYTLKKRIENCGGFWWEKNKENKQNDHQPNDKITVASLLIRTKECEMSRFDGKRGLRAGCLDWIWD